jgi:intraflagellar transport protein 140
VEVEREHAKLVADAFRLCALLRRLLTVVAAAACAERADSPQQFQFVECSSAARLSARFHPARFQHPPRRSVSILLAVSFRSAAGVPLSHRGAMSSVFFEYATDLASKAKGAILATAFSNADQQILAASTKNGDLTMYLEEGEHLDPEVTLHRTGECAHLQWHPKLSLLATGWDDGTVAVWGEKERVMREEANTHKAPITLLTFSPEGSRLISGDSNGCLVVWNVDHRGRLTQVCKYEKKGAITHLVFRAPANLIQPADGSVLPCPSFFFGGSSGIIVFADDLGHSSDVIKAGSPISTMYYNQPNDYLVLVTVDVVLYKYKITPEGKMTQERKVKLSIKGDGSDLQAVFAGHGLLAAANSENLVRLWHLEKEDNYVLSLSDPKHMAIPKDIITCLAFNPTKRVLCAGTLAGRVVFWRFIGRSNTGADPSAEDWEVMPPVETNYGGSGSGLGVQTLKWGPGEGLLAVASKEGVSVLNETVLHSKHLDKTGVSLIQLSSDAFCLQTAEGRVYRVQTAIRIKGFDMSEKYIITWNGKKCEVREVPDFKAGGSGDLKILSTFASKAQLCVLSGENIYACVGARIEVLSISGVLKNALAFTEADGVPAYLAATEQWMVCATSHNLLKLWDISRREPKTIVPGRSLDAEPGLKGIQLKNLRINSNGTKVAIIANLLHEEHGAVQTPDSRLHIYDVELDRVFSYEFGPRYYPVRQYWDNAESKLLAVETKKFELQEKAPSKDAEKKAEERKDEEADGEPESDALNAAEVTTLFATSDYGVLMQDSFAIEASSETLMALSVPHVLFMTRPSDDEYEGGASNAMPHLKRRVMRDFIGLETVDEDAKRDLLAFSYFLTVGNMDEAYRAVKKISSTTIWENMAHMAVKTRRLDIAEVCLGNMGNARGAKAVRESKKEPEKEAQVAMLAIQLNLLDDAERLYKECGRYDLLVQLYTASGRWKDALRICAKHCRIHLKTTHYQYARHLEHLGDTVQAIKNYEKSETHKHEVPRMLFDSQHIADLEQYIKASEDAQLIRWWAQYCESNGSYDEAIKYYDQAKETLALVRVLVYRGQDDKAAKICQERGDLAACYHLARQYEQQERISDAIAFYKLSKRYNHGIRLAKEHFLDNDLLQLALECSNKDLKVDAARFFEAKGDMDKAVLLYQKGGKIPRALELCFKGELFDSLRTISESLGPETDPALLAKCGDFFFSHGQFEKAVHLFITAKQYLKALTLCMKHNVKITEAMAEKMTPPKSKDENEKKAREDLLKKLARQSREPVRAVWLAASWNADCFLCRVLVFQIAARIRASISLRARSTRSPATTFAR